MFFLICKGKITILGGFWPFHILKFSKSFPKAGATPP